MTGNKTSTSFIAFLINLIIIIGVLIAATLFPMLHVNAKNAVYLAFAQIFVAVVSTIGIYSGFKLRKQTSQNRFNNIGLWGNVLLFLYTLGLMIYGLILI